MEEGFVHAVVQLPADQQPPDLHKICSWHEPEVQCLSKGKAHQPYEVGRKVALATTNRSNWTSLPKSC